MDLRSRLDYFRKEHDEILGFLKNWENALEMAAHDSDEQRVKGLVELRKMENDLLGIRQHCREEEQTVESPFQIYLDDALLARLAEEHELLRRLSNDFLRELTFATMFRTDELVGLGRELLEQLRRHIALETTLLKQVEDGRAAEEKVWLQYSQPAE